MANLLQKASIVLTPTAYDNGKVLCAKPSEPPYGDFDFSRNSAATRVNAQGLVENVQILSSNLVQNGDFSEEGVQEISNGSFSQEGSELITNGDFDTDSDWSKGTGWSISGGTANSNDTNSFIFQNLSGTTTNDVFKVTYTISNYVSGNVAVGFGSGLNQPLGTQRNANGTYTEYLTKTSTSIAFGLKGFSFIGSIDNVSVREVGQDWSLGTGWSIGEDKVIYDGSGYSGIGQIIPNLIGKIFKVQFDIIDYTSGTIRISPSNKESGSDIRYSNNGTYVEYYTSAQNRLDLQPQLFNGSITNISVKEVGQNWDFTSTTTVGDGFANIFSDGSYQYIRQQNVLQIGRLYKLTYEITRNNGGSIKSTSFNTSTLVSDVGIHTLYRTASQARLFIERNQACDIDITNISVIEITDDTNLPRINYEGFSYQDALGSEEIDLTTGSTLEASAWGSVTTSGVSYLAGAGAISYYNTGFVVTSGLTYKISFTLSGYTGTGELGFSTAGGVSASARLSANGSYTEYFTASANQELRIFGRSTNTGVFSNVSVKEYLGQEVVPDSGCGSWLWEPQSTNLLPYSENFTVGNWAKTRCTITSNQAISPDGTLNASLMTSTDDDARLGDQVGSSGAEYTQSIYVKSAQASDVDCQIDFAGLNAVTFTANQQWQRVETTLTDTSQSPRLRLRIQDSGNSIYIWGAQLEQQSYATSYIPTSGSSVTRNQDVCNNGGSLASINSTEGVLYAEIAALANDLTDRTIALSDGTISNTVRIQYLAVSNAIWATVTNIGAGGNQGVVRYTSTDITINSKVALKFAENDFALWVDGVEVDTDTSGVTFPANTLNTLQFDRGNGTQNFFGKTKALAVWKEALSDQELADLTYPTPTDPTFTLDFDTIATDFTFARGSEATYVDAQGLIKSTNEIGEELITNGDFSNGSTDWSLGAGVSISSEKAVLTNVSNATQCIIQNNVVVVGKTYKITFTISDYNQGAVYVIRPTSLGSGSAVSANGTFSFTMEAQTSTAFILFTVGTTTLSIDNVSVKEVITATNTPRLDYSTGAEAFLLEPQSTNLVTYSEDFSNASWSKSNCVIGSEAVSSPSGVIGVSSVTNTSLFGRLSTIQNLNNGISYTYSFWCKNIDITTPLSIYLNNSGIALDTFTPTSEWVRYQFTWTSSSTITETIAIQDRIGTALGSYMIWGAQLEALSYATSYIPSAGSQTTRNQETCINATPEINSEEGVLYAEIAALSNDLTNRIISITNGASVNGVSLYYSSSSNVIRANYYVGGVAQCNLEYILADETDFSKIAFVWKINRFELWVDSIKRAEDLSGAVNVANTMNDLSFRRLGGNIFFGNTKDLQVYTKALSDAELIKLTT